MFQTNSRPVQVCADRKQETKDGLHYTDKNDESMNNLMKFLFLTAMNETFIYYQYLIFKNSFFL